MDRALTDACLEEIQKASKPMSVAEIGSVCLGRSKPNERLVEALKQLADRKKIHQWPTYRKSQIFGNRPLRSAIEEAFVTALDEARLDPQSRKAREPRSWPCVRGLCTR